MSVGMYLRRLAANFPVFPRTREWLQKADATLIGADKNWLAGQLTGAMSLGAEEAGDERKVVIGTMDDGQRICGFYVRGQRADGGCYLWA